MRTPTSLERGSPHITNKICSKRIGQILLPTHNSTLTTPSPLGHVHPSSENASPVGEDVQGHHRQLVADRRSGVWSMHRAALPIAVFYRFGFQSALPLAPTAPSFSAGGALFSKARGPSVHIEQQRQTIFFRSRSFSQRPTICTLGVVHLCTRFCLSTRFQDLLERVCRTRKTSTSIPT